MGNEQDSANEPEAQKNVAAGDNSGEVVDPLKDPARRLFFKRAAVGGGAARISLEGRPVSDYPHTDKELFRPKDQRDTILNFVSSKALNEKHPERNEQYNRLQDKQFDWVNGFRDMCSNPVTQVNNALSNAGNHSRGAVLAEAFAGSVRHEYGTSVRVGWCWTVWPLP